MFLFLFYSSNLHSMFWWLQFFTISSVQRHLNSATLEFNVLIGHSFVFYFWKQTSDETLWINNILQYIPDDGNCVVDTCGGCTSKYGFRVSFCFFSCQRPHNVLGRTALWLAMISDLYWCTHINLVSLHGLFVVGHLIVIHLSLSGNTYRISSENPANKSDVYLWTTKNSPINFFVKLNCAMKTI